MNIGGEKNPLKILTYITIYDIYITTTMIVVREVDWVNSGGEKIPSQQPAPTLQPEHWALV